MRPVTSANNHWMRCHLLLGGLVASLVGSSRAFFCRVVAMAHTRPNLRRNTGTGFLLRLLMAAALLDPAAARARSDSCNTDVSQSRTCLSPCEPLANMRAYLPYPYTPGYCLYGLEVTNWTLISMNGSESWWVDFDGNWSSPTFSPDATLALFCNAERATIVRSATAPPQQVTVIASGVLLKAAAHPGAPHSPLSLPIPVAVATAVPPAKHLQVDRLLHSDQPTSRTTWGHTFLSTWAPSPRNKPPASCS